MKKKRPKQKATKPRPPASDAKEEEQSGALLQYKVIELSTVDELSLEQAINQRVAEGWRLETIHFAMRDSSKRPAMAFILFARPSAEARENPAPRRTAIAEDDPADRAGGRVMTISSDPWKRLRELAGVEEDQQASPRRSE